jgi:hypothetical protein
MPVQVQKVEDGQRRVVSGDKMAHLTPPPAKKKATKTERASMLCSTPPTCIKDKDSHVEYTRKEFLGEVNCIDCVVDDRVDLLGVIWLRIDKVVHLLPKSSQKHLSKHQRQRERYTPSGAFINFS